MKRSVMSFKNPAAWSLRVLAITFLVVPVLAQSERGKAELSVSGGKMVVDYGRPQLKGRDPLTWQKEGSYWRMGMNDMTTLSTPVDLMFGSTRIPKGTYGLWLLKAAADRYELVFNSVSSGMGMMHDKSKDVAAVPMKKEAVPASVETLTLELKGGPKDGTFALTWGTARLSCDFQVAK